MERSKPLDPGNAPAKVGYLLVGHGTRKVSGQQQFRALFQQFQSRLAPLPCELAFLELAEPSILDGMERLAARGVTSLVTVPVLLFSAGHAQMDIPAEVARAASLHGMEVRAQSSALECCPAMLELSAQKYRQAVCRANPLAGTQVPTACDSTCEGDSCPQVGLAMIGRGSRSDAATHEMLKFTEMRCQLTPVPWHTTGFIQVQSPTVNEALDQLQDSPTPIAVVQPHLLFEGELIQQLRAEVGRRQALDPRRKWLITDPLGADESLARTLVSMALGAVAIDP